MFSLLVVLCILIIAFLMLFALAELLSVFLDVNDLIIKIMLLPFLIAFISFLAKFIFSMLKKEKVVKICDTIFSICFYSYVFGLLVFAIINAIIHKKYASMIVPVILIILLMCLILRKKKKRK